MSQTALEFLLSLTTTLVLPATIWVLAAWRVCRLRGLDETNYEEKVRETLEGEIIKKMSEKLDELFPQYGLTPPSRSAPFPMVIKQLLQDSPDRLTQLTDMYNSLVETGLQSPVFLQVLQAVLAIMSGAHSPLDQFAINPLILMKVENLYFSFTNPSLSMLLTLCGVFLFLSIVILKMKGTSDSAKRKALTIGGASGFGGEDRDDERKKMRISTKCRNNFIISIRELIIELSFAAFKKEGEAHKLINADSHRWNWVIKNILEEYFGERTGTGTGTGTLLDIRNMTKILAELASAGAESTFFKRVLALLEEVEKNNK